MCIRSLRHKYAGYRNVTTKYIIKHLYDSYVWINKQGLKDNDHYLKESYDLTQFEDTVNYASTDSVPCIVKQVVNVACNLIFEISIYNNNYKI